MGGGSWKLLKQLTIETETIVLFRLKRLTIDNRITAAEIGYGAGIKLAVCNREERKTILFSKYDK